MIYTYKCEKCEHRFERNIKMADMNVPLEEPCEECGESGHIKKTIESAQMWIDPERLGRIKPPDGFRELMRAKKKAYPRSTIKDELH